MTAVGDRSVLPDVTALSVCPNPFNPTTTITYDVAKAGRVSLAIFDVAGRRVETLIDREHHGRDRYRVRYETTLATGVYFARLVTPAGKSVRKIVVLK